MKRLVVIAVTLLLAGAVVNVAVAWGCVRWSPRTYMDMAESESVAWPAAAPTSWPTPAGAFRFGGLGWDVFIPGASTRSEGGDYMDRVEMHLLSSGWPCRSLSALTQHECTEKVPASLHKWKPRFLGAMFDTRPLPLLARWPGFAVNTIFYAAVLWLFICGPFALRRLIRRRRGLCPACAYPVGESAVCTECGKALPRRTETAT